MAGKSAVLTVKILSDASGASKGLNESIQKVSRFQSGLSKAAGPAGKDVGSSLVKGVDSVLGTGLKIVGGAGAVVMGTALAKGFGRLTAIDDAKAKLLGLGHSAAEVEKIMKNATTAVKGTAFGLDEAATTAASVVAAGIKPGKELTSVLTTVADTATIAGTSMGDMGSIFAKVAASNKVTGETLQQLTDKGVPALQMIAKHYGVTAAKASQMVSKGKVDFKNFAAAMKEGVGGAAKQSGKTFKGAWANVMASLGRIGANLMAPLFDGSKSVLQDLPGMLAGVEDKATDVGVALGKMMDWSKRNVSLLKTLAVVGASAFAALLAIRTVVAVWQAFNAVMAIAKAAQLGYAAATYGTAAATSYMTAATTAQKVAIVAGVAAQKIATAAEKTWTGVLKVATAAQWAWNAAMNANPISLVVVAVVALIAVIVLLWTKCAGFQNFWKAVWKGMQSVTVAVWKAIRAAGVAVFTFLQPFIRGVMKTLTVAMKVFGTAAKLVWLLIRAAAIVAWTAILLLVKGVMTGVNRVVRAVKGPITAVWSAIRSAARTAWSGVSAAVRSAMSVVRSVVGAVKGPILAVWSAIRSVASSVWRAIAAVARAEMGVVRSVVQGVKGPILAVWNGIKAATSSVWRALASIIRSALSPITGMINGIESAFNGLIGAVQTLISWLSKIHVPHIHIPGVGSSKSSAPAAVYPATYGYAASPTLAGIVGARSAPALMGGGNVTINAYGILDGTDGARVMRRVLRNDERRRGGVLIGNDYSRRRAVTA